MMPPSRRAAARSGACGWVSAVTAAAIEPGGALSVHDAAGAFRGQVLGVPELVGALRHDDLRQTTGERPDHRAGAAVVHHEVDVREKLRLRDLLLDVHPCRQFTEGAGLNSRAGGHKHLTSGAGDLERR